MKKYYTQTMEMKEIDLKIYKNVQIFSRFSFKVESVQKQWKFEGKTERTMLKMKITKNCQKFYLFDKELRIFEKMYYYIQG